MKRVLLIVLCLSTLASCFVSRQRRVVNTDEDEPKTATTKKPICSDVTPCQWMQYNESTKKVIDVISNSYCDCKPNTACEIHEDDASSFVFILRCLPLLGSNNATMPTVPES